MNQGTYQFFHCSGQADQIQEFIDIARETDQTSKIMNFPPIDHDSAIS